MGDRNKFQAGFTLIEAMVLLVILSIVAVAAGVGLQAVAKVPTVADQIMALNNAAVDTMEQWKAKSWATMNPSSPFASPYSLTDTVTINGKSYSPHCGDGDGRRSGVAGIRRDAADGLSADHGECRLADDGVLCYTTLKP